MYTLTTSKSKGNHTLIYPLSKLELSLKKNEVYQGSLTFEVKPMCEISGFMYADNYRMQCVGETFAGNNLELVYTFDATGLEEDDIVQGEFYLVTSIGEYTLPFEIAIVGETLQTSIGTIRNLFHFVNLARTDWKEAVEVFYRPEFEQIFIGSDKQYRSAYRGLCTSKMNEASVEEFLILIRKKQAVSYTLEDEEVHLKGTVREENSFRITRNNWGYTKLSLRSDATFLKIDKEELTDADFISGQATVHYHIDSKALHAGRNLGRIVIEDALEQYTYDVIVEPGVTFAKRTSDVRKNKQLIIQFCEEYIHYQVKHDTQEWNETAEELLNRMVALNGRNVLARMYQAEIFFKKKHDNEAKWILRHVDDILENRFSDLQEQSEDNIATILAYRLYLDGAYAGDEADKKHVIAELRKLSAQHPDNFNCFRWLMRLDDAAQKDTVGRLHKLEEVYKRGNRSPLLYLEAYLIYEASPSLLDSLDDLGVQTMFFACKYHMLTQEMITQINYLANKQRKMTRLLYSLLSICYEWDDTTETLQTICTLLIKNEKMQQQYFKWYAKAVEEELRITRLYEYYLLSIDLMNQDLLPRTVLMYFSYQCELDYVHAAYLYANVLKHEEDIPDLYQSYVEQIEHFVYNQVNLGHINDDLAYLYKKVICAQMIDDNFARALIRLLFTVKVIVADKSVRYVVLIEAKCTQEKKFAVNGGKVYFPVYDEEYAILLETADGNRYAVSIPYTLKETHLKHLFWDMVEEYAQDNTGASLYFCQNHSEIGMLSEMQRAFFVRIYRDMDYADSYRRQIGLQLMRHYFDDDNTSSLDQFLVEVDLRNYTRSERAEIIKLLVLRDMNKKAYEALITYGFEGISYKQLLRLFEYGMDKFEEKDNEQLLAIANCIFDSGKFNETVVRYLAANFKGNLRRMRLIWEKALELKISAKELAARIIEQTLFSGAYVARRQDIFRYYYEAGANPELVENYLSQCAYQYFVKEQVMDENVFAIMLETEQLTQICKIAVVHFFAENPAGMSYQEKEKVCNFIRELMAENIYFPFFNRFAKYVPILLPMAEKTFIEYRTLQASKVILHYVAGDSTEQGEYHTEEMKEIYEGYYCESFILFFGEKLQYYITEVADGVESLTESGTIEKNDTLDLTEESRFDLINQMVMSHNLNEEESVRDMALEYARQSYVTDKLFEIR